MPSSMNCASCKNTCCSTCKFQCEECKVELCSDCIDECDRCNKMFCRNCMYDNMVCGCCLREISIECESLCFRCLMSSWFKDGHSFRCVECIELCNNGTCNVQQILSSQTTCPICLDPFVSKPFSLQVCGLHKVCSECDYPSARGCPSSSRSRAVPS